jgi:hypothetical protein
MTETPKQTEAIWPKAQLTVSGFFERSVVLGEKLGHLFKLLTPLAVISGIYLVADFTGRAGAPFPSIDVSFLIFLAIIVMALFGAACGVVLIPLLPWLTLEREYLKPSYFQYPRDRWLYAERYCFVFLLFLLGFISLPLMLTVGASLDSRIRSGSNPEVFLHLSFYGLSFIGSLLLFGLGTVISYRCQRHSIIRDGGNIDNLKPFFDTTVSSSFTSYWWAVTA